MSPLSDDAMKDLARQAFESEDDAPSHTDSCGSYSSLALLLTQGHSDFVSPRHVAGCVRCGPMLARLLVKKCPSVAVLRQYRQPGDYAGIAALGWHISGCRWCKFRLAFLPPRSAAGAPLAVFAASPITIAAAAIVLLLAVNGWLVVQNRRERAELAGREKQWAVERHNAEQRIQALTRPQPATTEEGRGATVPVILSIVLPPGVFRDASEKVFSIPPGTDAVLLKLQSDTRLAAGAYDVEIRSVGEKAVYRKTITSGGSAASVTASVPAPSLPPGRYFVSLAQGGQVLLDYSFRVK